MNRRFIISWRMKQINWELLLSTARKKYQNDGMWNTPKGKQICYWWPNQIMVFMMQYSSKVNHDRSYCIRKKIHHTSWIRCYETVKIFSQESLCENDISTSPTREKKTNFHRPLKEYNQNMPSYIDIIIVRVNVLYSNRNNWAHNAF